ncbi:MAG: hypothetical protein IKJ01_03255 [Lachnospiraceae bacterium]|nr:hypothetical protein [Lachnospiraceae bacterium]
MATIKLYDSDAYQTTFEAEVLACTEKMVLSTKKQKTQENNSQEQQKVYEVILNQTLFFPEEGGQTPDNGTLGNANVIDVQITKDNTILHTVDKALEVGQSVKGEINWQHRFFNMQQHSGEHLFSGLVYKQFGFHNVGFHLSNQIVTMDFDGVLSSEDVDKLEWVVNQAIIENVEIKTSYPSKAELADMEYRSKIEIDGDVRIVEVVGYDMCACCAPHVHYTGEIGIFKIQNVQSYKGGVRISFLCGFRALMEFRKKSSILTELSGILTTNPESLAENVSKLKAQTQSLKMELGNAKQSIMENKIASIPIEQKNVLLFEAELDTPIVRNIINKLTEQHEGICGIFTGTDKEGYSFIIGSKTADCREIAKLLKEKLQARGGGSSVMIQGSVKALEGEIKEILL